MHYIYQLFFMKWKLSALDKKKPKYKMKIIQGFHLWNIYEK
jgi:hypothetical protein